MSETRVRAPLHGKDLILAILRWILIIFFAVYTLFPLIWLAIASSVEACPAEIRIFHKGDVTAFLRRSECRRVPAGAAPDDGEPHIPLLFFDLRDDRQGRAVAGKSITMTRMDIGRRCAANLICPQKREREAEHASCRRRAPDRHAAPWRILPAWA